MKTLKSVGLIASCLVRELPKHFVIFLILVGFLRSIAWVTSL